MKPPKTRSDSAQDGNERESALSQEKRVSVKRTKASQEVANEECETTEDESIEDELIEDDDDNERTTIMIAPPSAPVLSNDEIRMVDCMTGLEEDEKIVQKFGLTIRARDLSLYKNLKWLEDRNVDFYLEMIRERSNQRDSGLKKVFIYHSIFYPLLMKRGYDEVKGFTKEENLFDYDLAFFPINQNGRHWSLVVVDFGKSQILHYDSLGSSGRARIPCYTKDIWKYLETESQTRREVELDNWQSIKFEDDEIPYQEGSNDCGIFMLQYANYISRGQEFDFNQEHVPYFRKRMAYETLEARLLD